MHRLAGPAARNLAVLALALATSACGGRMDKGEGTASTPAMTGPAVGAVSAMPPAAATHEAPDAPAATSPAPTLDLPDLSGIDAYLVDIDGALGADGGAGAQEGSDQ